MNYAGKFDANLSADAFGFHLQGQGRVETITHHATHAPADAIIVADPHLLFTGDFKRSGVDLILSGDNQELLVPDYFKTEKRAPLSSPDGAHLTGDIVTALTGHTQFAQAGGTTVGKVIGHVSKLAGTATAVRNGVSIILNNGDNVEKGDVVQSGSDSTLGITFIDGTVFGLSSNARMVLNEMVYDPNGSSNSSLLSLVAGTITFVAGETAKHGDMKVDTPVATMGIRGTAVLVEVDFEIPIAAPSPSPPPSPSAKFQVLVEPDGTTGSYILFDKNTLTPIATVNQAGQQINISQGQVTITNAPLPPDIQKLITDVFSLKFTSNDNPKTFDHFTDTVVPQSLQSIILASGATAIPLIVNVSSADRSSSSGSGGPLSSLDHIPGPPAVVVLNGSLVERAGATHDSTIDILSSKVTFADINAGDLPTVSVKFDSFSYQNAAHQDVTATLNAQQLADIAALEVNLGVVQDAGNKNTGSATWTYSLADSAFDFLAAGETVTLTYLARVDNNFALNNEFTIKPFTITITGTNDAPTVAAASAALTQHSGALDHAGGTITFSDVDLTDRPVVSTAFTSFSFKDAHGNDVTSNLTAAQQAAIAAIETSLTLTPSESDANNGTISWSYDVPDDNLAFLGDGETLTLTYLANVDDGHGGTASTPVTVTIIGSGNVPFLVTELAGHTGDTVDHDTVAGTLAFAGVGLTSVDSTLVSAIWSGGSSLPNGLIGDLENSFTVSGANSVEFNFSPADSNFDFLAEGETLTIIFDVNVTDSHGLSSTRPVTFIVTGTNDAPTIVSGSTSATGAVTEDTNVNGSGNLATSGSIAFADVDLIDTHSASFVLKSSTSSAHLPGFIDNSSNIGTFALTSVNEDTTDTINTGSVGWSFTLNDSDAVLQSLALGETLTQVYTVTITDTNGAPVTQDVTVTVTGVNDAPTIVAGSTSATGAVTEDTNVNGAGNLATSGSIAFADVDLIDSHSASFALKSSTSSAHLPGFIDNSSNIGTFALTSVNENTTDTINTASLGWSFTLNDNNAVLQSLALGQTLTQVYTVTITDNNGAPVTQDVTVTLTGTNDAPTIVAGSTSATGAVTEDTNVNGSGNLATSGSIAFADVDLIDTHSASFVLKSSTSTAHLPGFVVDTTNIGTFALTSVNENTVDTINTASLGWSFTLNDDDPVLQSLALGETLTQVYTVTITDNNGAPVTQDVTVTIAGTNDSLAIVSATNTTPSLAEDSVAQSLNLAAAGIITFSDVDLINTHTASFALKSSTSSAHLPGFIDNSSNIGTFALTSVNEDTTDTINTGSVGWSFTLNDSDAVLQSLALGQTVTQIYTVTIVDTHGASTSQDVTVTLVGTNDAPTIVAGSTSATGAVTEDTNVNGSGNLATSGSITFSDVDLIDSHSASFALKSSTSSAHLPGFIDNSSNIGTFALTSVNENTADTINTGSLGWSFTLNDNNAVLQSLAPGQTLTQVYTVTITDNNGAPVTQDVTVTLTGTNDAPTIVSGSTSATGAVTEDTNVNGSGNLATSGSIAFADVDLIDTHSASFVLKSSTSSAHLPGFIDNSSNIGTFALTSVNENTADTVNTASLSWSFTLNDNNAVLQSLALGQTLTQVYTVTITDNNGAPVTQDVTVTLTGINDAPVLDASKTPVLNSENQGSGPPVNGTAVGTLVSSLADLSSQPGGLDNVADVDSGAVTGIALTGTDTSHGIWFYSIDGGDHWIAVGSVSATSALLLATDANTRLYFQPNAGYSGTDTNAITFHAWDQTIGVNGTIVSITGTGSSTAFSTATDTANITINPVDVAPHVDLNGPGPGDNNTASFPHNSVTPILIAPNASITDVDSTNLVSMAVTLTNPQDNSAGGGGVNIKEVLSLTAAGTGYAAQHGLSVSFSSITHLTDPYTMTVTGSATLADYQYILQNIQYQDTKTGNQNTTIDRIVSVVVNDGVLNSAAETVTIDVRAPAGSAGAPINLALADPSTDHLGPISVTVSGIPSGWSLSEGSSNADGSWTLQANDIAALTITPLNDFAGALVLNVAMSWTNPDGTLATTTIPDNLEVYGKGTPIFAWSGDDYLTASSDKDLLVFSQPIGHDTVYSFNASVDRIDLVSFTGFATFADVQAHLSEDTNGNAVITIADGQSITLNGVHAASLTADDFVFDQPPAFSNTGIISIHDGALLPLSGIVNNSGAIELNSTGYQTDLQLIASGLTLDGGGQIILSDNDANAISGTDASVKLDNEDNTISGAGQLGAGELNLINAGIINANGAHSLTVDTGSNSILNSGVLEASGSGGMVVASAIVNSGVLWANGAHLTLEGDVSGNGVAKIDGAGTLDFDAPSTANVVFGAGAVGTLKIGDSFHFNGAISGFAGSDTIDLADLSGATSLSYHENSSGTGGILTVSDGSAAVNLSLLGVYTADNFSIVPDHAKGTAIVYVAHDLIV